MLYNEKEKQHIMVLTGGEGDYTITGDGLVIEENYELNYKFDKSGITRKLLSIKGMDLVKSTNRVLNTFFNKDPNLGEIRRELQQFVVLYGTGLIDTHLFRKIKKGYPKDVVFTVKKGMKGKGEHYLLLKDVISTYLYLTFIMNKETSMVSNTLTLCDSVGTEMDDSTKEFYRENWKEQNVTKRLGIKSLDEFMKHHIRGVLHYEWSVVGGGLYEHQFEGNQVVYH